MGTLSLGDAANDICALSKASASIAKELELSSAKP
jgi:hypothetical protein